MDLTERLDYSSKSAAVYEGNQRLFKEAKEEIELLEGEGELSAKNSVDHLSEIRMLRQALIDTLDCLKESIEDPDTVAISIVEQALSGHVHNWVDARNEIVKDGEVCLECGAIRAGNQATALRGE